MVQLGRYILIILATCFLLQACSSVRIAQELQLAKVTFDYGDYKKAFRQLMPLAVEGSPEAQYAVGYMYYYGYGVTQDTESGLFWINRSTSKHYIPAIKALELIHKNNLKRPPPEKKSIKYKYSKNQLVESLKDPDIQNKMASIKKENKIAEQPRQLAYQSRIEDEPDEVLLSLKPEKENKIGLTNKAKYTLQVFGSYNLDTVKQLQTRLNLLDSTHYALTQNKGRDWYVLTYGKYPAIYLAKLAKDDLPRGLKELKPWVRKTEDLHWIG